MAATRHEAPGSAREPDGTDVPGHWKLGEKEEGKPGVPTTY